MSAGADAWQRQDPDQSVAKAPDGVSLRVQLLDSFRVSCNGRTFIDETWGRGKAKALIKLLALAAPTGLHREQVIEALWPQQAAVDSAGSLRQAIFQIRSKLKDDGHDLQFVETSGHILRLEAGVSIDFYDFITRARRALSVGEDEALFDEAHAAWRGDLLPADLYEDWTQTHRDQVRDLHFALLRESVSLCMRRGRIEKSISYLKGMLAVDPPDEEVHRQLMLAYTWSGKRHLAIRQYETCREILLSELDAEPTPETQNLYQRIQMNAVQTAEAVAPSDEIFVGRREELRLLRRALRAAAAGRGRTSLAVADPGMGKSRTAKEIAREAVLAGYKALWGRCSEVEGAPAFGPWIDIIRAYVESANPNDLATDMGDGAGYIAQIVPEIRSVLPDVPDIAIIDADQARYQLFDSVAVFLRNAARRQPLAIVLDDLHGADLPSLLLLQFVARRLGDSRVFLLTTTRSAAARSASHPLSTAIAEMAREAGFQEIELAGLSAAETGQIVAAVAGAPVSQALVESVYERAGGNPFFTIEIARILVRTLDLSDEQAARQARELIPPTARAAITARLRGVSSECYRLLSLASVIGRRFRIGVLAQAAGITVAVALVGLQEALDVQLIGGLPDDPTGFIFSHALIMGTLYEAIPASSRPRLHEQVGLAMEQAADQHEGYLAEIAHHFVQSAQGGGDPGRAIDYSMRAAAQATKLTAYEDSVRHLETALELNTNLAEANDERQFEILITLGRALIRGGKLEAGDEVLWKAVALARQLDDPKFMARAAIAVGPDTWYGQTVSRGWSDKVVAALHEAEALWGEQDAPEHALLLAQLAMAKFAGVEIDLAIEFAERAEVMSRRLIADDTLLTAVLAARYITLQAVPDAVQQRLSVASEMLLRARTAGAIDAEFKALVWRNAAHLQLADRAAVDSGLEEIQALADATRVPYMRWLSLNLCASREILSGRLAEGDGLARQALEVGRDAIDYPAELTYAATHQFQECFFVQGAGRLAPVFQGVLPMLTAIDAFRCQFAHTLIEAGDCEGAREHLDHFASEQFENIRHDEVWLYALCQLAEVAIALGDERSVDGIAGKLQPLAGNCVIVSDGVSWWGSVCHYLGKLNAALGRYDRAVAYFERALEVHSRMEAPPFIALTQIDYGQTLRQRCAPGDERTADELIGSARETAARFGLDALLRRIER